MQSELETLLIIQDRDQKIQDLQKEIANLPQLAKQAETRLAGNLKTLEQVKSALQELELQVRRLERETITRRDTIDKLKTQQFETRKNDEFTAIAAEIERYAKDVSDLETEELELMEKGDELTTQREEAEAALNATKSQVNQELQALKERKLNNQEQIQELEEGRKKFVGQIDPALYDVYHRILKSKGASVVVRLAGGQCKGCHMKVTAATIVAAKSGKEITHCENCGRILYYDG